MSDDHQSNDNSQKTWLERIATAFSSEPQSREDVEEVLQSAGQNHLLEPEVLAIIEGAMQISRMQVREVMIPRSQMITVRSTQDPREFLPTVIQSAHSRFPVLGENPDEIIGILLAKDLLKLSQNPNSIDRFNLKEVLRPANVVPESKRLHILLREFRNNRNHMAIVIDEYGGIAGLVTIEDVLEQIVGDIEDEHDFDDDDGHIKPQGDNLFIVKSLTTIEEFNSFFETDYSDEEFDTIGGIVMQNFGRLPKRDEQTVIGDYQFTVLNADSRRIRLLEVTPVQ